MPYTLSRLCEVNVKTYSSSVKESVKDLPERVITLPEQRSLKIGARHRRWNDGESALSLRTKPVVA